jgi:hypothetical protein
VEVTNGVLRPFIGSGRRGGAVQGTTNGGGELSRHRLLEGETTGQRRFMRKLKRTRRRIFSFLHLALERDNVTTFSMLAPLPLTQDYE